jgi:superfamily II DNA or RNA helicase
MREALALRTFQREALDALVKRFHEEAAQRLAVVLPTGAGKTFCFAHQTLEHLRDHPDEQAVILVHTDELVEQTFEELLAVAPHLKAGIVKAARNDVDAQVIVASVQSLRNPERRKQIKNVTLVIVDEGHHVLAKTYLDVLTDFGCFGGKAKAVGYTATLIRGDGQGLGKVWQDVAYKKSIGWMVRQRYLIPPKGIAVEVPALDLTGVKGKNDFNDADLGEALTESLAPELVAKAYVENAADRKGILFAPTVVTAYQFAEALREAGITADTIHGGLPLGDRDNPAPGTRRYILRAHKAGEFQVLTNCQVLTEGYNDPTISCVVNARPTRSKGLYVQMVGRGLRVDFTRDYDEQDCLILDVVGANAVHDLDPEVDLSTRKKREKREGETAYTLVDLADEFDAGEGVGEDRPDYYEGDIITREFDPLGNKSTKVWMKSKGGVFFVPTGKDGYTFIMQYPEPGRWSVAWCTTDSSIRWHTCAAGGKVTRECVCGKKCAGRQVGMTEYRGLSLEVAMGWAEDVALDLNADSLNKAKRNAPWRKRPASDAIRWKARNLGITVDPEARMGALSDQIDAVLGTNRIDPLVAAVTGKK